MKKINGRIISLLTSAALLATGTAPQAFAEAVKDGHQKQLLTILCLSRMKMKNRRISQVS